MYKNKEWRVVTSQISTISFWGGSLFSCGEYELSSLLIERAQHLKQLTCFPRAGVEMVRPLYCKNNRAGKHIFPVLEEMTMMDVGTPFDHGYITPNLKKITLILRTTDENVINEEWVRLIKAKELFSQNKKLVEIQLVSVPGERNDNITSVMKIFTPQYNFWHKRKLMLLAIYKESMHKCPLAKLPYDILRSICHMSSGSWIIQRNRRVRAIVK